MGSTKTFKQRAVWVYDKVITNTHNAYSAITGKFTTPERGLYMFSIDTMADPGKMSHASLNVNGSQKIWQACNNSSGKYQWLTCSNTAILLLQKGDVVYVADNSSSGTVRELFSSFSGAKLN